MAKITTKWILFIGIFLSIIGIILFINFPAYLQTGMILDSLGLILIIIFVLINKGIFKNKKQR